MCVCVSVCVGPTSEQLTKSAATGFCLKLSLRSGISRLLVLEQTSHTGGNTSTIFNLYLLMSAPFTKTTAFKAPRSGWQSKLRFRKALSMAEVGASKSWPGKCWTMMHQPWPNHPMHGLLVMAGHLDAQDFKWARLQLHHGIMGSRPPT